MGYRIVSLPTNILKKHERWLYLSFLEDYATGMNAESISQKRKCSKEFVVCALADLNQETKDQMKDIVLRELPLQFRASIVLLRKVIETSQRIIDSTQEARVQHTLLALQRECSRDITDLLNESMKLSR